MTSKLARSRKRKAHWDHCPTAVTLPLSKSTNSVAFIGAVFAPVPGPAFALLLVRLLKNPGRIKLATPPMIPFPLLLPLPPRWVFAAAAVVSG
jgi:hypothetical protein